MAEAKKAIKKVPADKTIQYRGTGRRKSSIARVRILPNGNGNIVVNGKSITEYFAADTLKFIVNQPLVLTNATTKYDIFCNVNGGGLTGQAGAIRHGVSRALVRLDETLKPELKAAGFMTRDSRVKERKKYGLKAARRGPQFRKR